LSHLNDREMDPEVLTLHHQQQQNMKNGAVAYENESEEEELSDEEDEDDIKPKIFSCELCRVDFSSSQELRSHVAEHFLNGGGIEACNDKKKQDKSYKLEPELDIEDLSEIELEEAQVDYHQQTTSQDEDESSSDDDSVTSPDENGIIKQLQPPLPKIQVQVHRCRICNAAYLESARSIECMMNHQKPTSFKCSECQLFFIGSKHLQDHEKLCHS